MYMLYYVIANEYPLRPVTGTEVLSDTVVTYTWESYTKLCIFLVLALALFV